MTPEKLFIGYANGDGKQHQTQGNFLDDLYAVAKEEYGFTREQMERARETLERQGKIRPERGGASYVLVEPEKNEPPTKEIGEIPE